MNEISQKYGFPLFVDSVSRDYLLKSEKIRVTDIWGLWHYIIKTEKSRHPGSTDYKFLLSLLEQAQYFYEAALSAPIKSQPLLFYYSFLNFVKVILSIVYPYGAGQEFYHGVDSCKIDSATKLKDTYITIKSFITPGRPTNKVSVAYWLSQFQKDTIQFNPAMPAPYDNGPWKFSIIGLLQSCIGIHRTVSETLKRAETFVRVRELRLYKDARDLSVIGGCEVNGKLQNQLIDAGYDIISHPDGTKTYKAVHHMNGAYLTKNDYLDFSLKIRKQGIWTYSDGNEFLYYISPQGFTKNPATDIYEIDYRTPGNSYQMLSSSTIIYLIMFFLGSITRYHPYLFESVLSDKEIWMVTEFLKTQPHQFIHTITSNFLTTKVLSSRMPK